MHLSPRPVSRLVTAALVSVALLLSACASKKTDDAAEAARKAAATQAQAVTGDAGAGADAAGAGAVADTSNVDAVRGQLRDRIYFAFDSATLTAQSMDVLRAQAGVLESSSEKIRLEGHADERGTPEYNVALGQRRADVARSFLIAQGVKASRIETVSYGEMKPAVAGHDEESWAKNRRVELRIVR